MKTIIWIIAITTATLFCIFTISGKRFKSSFYEHALQLKWVAGKQDSIRISEADLDSLPVVVARYLRYSGIVGRNKISSMHLTHSGIFRPGIKSSFFKTDGEIYLTTKKPSFLWYGKITLVPGITIAAADRYINAKGNMMLKLMSTITIATSNSIYNTQSSYGRCVAEMTMIPSFFLDNERVKWVRSDSVSAECIVTDSAMRVEVQLFFNTKGSLDRIMIFRYFSGADDEPLLEKFTGKFSGSRNHNGLILPEIFDGYWNLEAGDLHYIHFVIENVDFE